MVELWISLHIKTMKKIYAILLTVVVSACGGDDGGSDSFAGVPSGTIVAVGERDFVLTGEDAGGRLAQVTYKWWELDVSKIDISGPEDCGDDEDLTQADTYVAFASNGDVRARIGTEGDGSVGGSWEWTSSSKDAIFLNGETSVEFKIRGLNESEVIYASKQSAGVCSAITWERFTR